MTIKLTCPVCDYKDIEVNKCPNCDTDLSGIRMLHELPVVENPGNKVMGWQLTAAVLLLIGIGLGSWSILTFFQPLQVISPAPIAVNPGETPKLPNLLVPLETTDPKMVETYTVKSGDNLTVITDKLCGKGVLWQVMVTANPQLRGREDYIDVGEVFKFPNCEEEN